LILHDTLAFTEAGTPLGVVDAQVWARDPEDRGKNVISALIPRQSPNDSRAPLPPVL